MTPTTNKVCLIVTRTTYCYLHYVQLLLPLLIQRGIGVCMMVDSDLKKDVEEKINADTTIDWSKTKIIYLPILNWRGFWSEILYRVAKEVWRLRFPGSANEYLDNKGYVARLGGSLAKKWMVLTGAPRSDFEKLKSDCCCLLEANRWFFKVASLCFWYGWMRFAFKAVGKLLFKAHITDRHLCDLATRMDDTTPFTEFLKQEKPGLVLADHGPFNAVYAAEANRLKIPLCYTVLSWDRITKMGLLPARFDHIVVWGDYVGSQASEILETPEDRITKVGCLNFDGYLQWDRNPSREEFCKIAGIDPTDKMILYCCPSSKFMDIGGPLLEALKKIVDSGRLPFKCHLLARGYPVDPKKKRENQVGSKGFSYLNPIKETDAKASRWGYDLDLPMRAATFAHADVVVNPAVCSGMFDALVFNKPVVVPFYDAGELYYHHSVKRWEKIPFYRFMMRAPGVMIVENDRQMEDAIVKFLIEPQHLENKRHNTLEPVSGLIDGKSHERLADTVENLLAGKK